MPLSSPHAVAVLAAVVLLVGACEESSTEPRENVAESWLFFAALAVNGDGVVVGTANRKRELGEGDTVWEVRVATWTQAGGLHVLPLPDGVDAAMGVDVNDAGQVLAVAVDTPSYTFSAHLWSGGGWSPLGMFYPTALGEDGTVVGFWRENPSAQINLPVRVAAGGTKETIDELLVTGSCGVTTTAIPKDVSGGVVVGNTQIQGSGYWLEAVALEASSATLLFGTEECHLSNESTADGVNESGWIVGWSGGLTTAYVQKPGSPPVSLGALPGYTDHWGVSCAYGVSDAGWIAGSSYGPSGDHAVRWNPAGEIEDLGLGLAFAVNDDGMTVGLPEVGGYYDPAVVWLPDGTRLELGGPNGTVGELDWRSPDGVRAYGAPAVPNSWPC